MTNQFEYVREDKLALVASTVSSKMVESIAHVEGFKFVECLTGRSMWSFFLLQLIFLTFIRFQVHWKYSIRSRQGQL
jgi:hypothetical protein